MRQTRPTRMDFQIFIPADTTCRQRRAIRRSLLFVGGEHRNDMYGEVIRQIFAPASAPGLRGYYGFQPLPSCAGKRGQVVYNKPYILRASNPYGLALASAIAPHGRILKAVALAGERVGWSIRQSVASRQTSRKQISPTISACAGKHKRRSGMAERSLRAAFARNIPVDAAFRRRGCCTQNPSRSDARGAFPRGKNAGTAKA